MERLLTPSYSLLLQPSNLPQVFGCVCFVHNLGPGFDKLDPHSTKCVFLDNSQTQTGYPILQSYSATLPALILHLLSPSHISLDVVLMTNISSTYLFLSRLRIHYLRHRFLYLSPSLYPQRPQLNFKSIPDTHDH
jgi:hypothetical protein